MNRTSRRQKVIDKCKSLLLKILKIERGGCCEICGKHTNNIGLFHILPTSRFPRIQLHKQNILLAGWYCCHYAWHHDHMSAKVLIEPKIKALRGEDYMNDLIKLDVTAEKLSLVRLNVIHEALKLELKSVL